MSASVRDRLRRTQFLEGLTDSALHQLAKLVTDVTYEPQTVIFEEGSPREFLAIIVSGAVAVEKGLNSRAGSMPGGNGVRPFLVFLPGNTGLKWRQAMLPGSGRPSRLRWN